MKTILAATLASLVCQIARVCQIAWQPALAENKGLFLSRWGEDAQMIHETLVLTMNNSLHC